jgi:hypothetical protein
MLKGQLFGSKVAAQWAIARWFVFGAAIALAGATLAQAQGAAGVTPHGVSGVAVQPNRSASGDSSSLPDAPAPQPTEVYEPITGKQRVAWVVISTVGPKDLAGGLLSAGIGTALDHPYEYGPHWGGFGARYGMRLTGVATSNVMEAGLGAIWGEDPRYKREPDKSFGGRVGSVLEQAFITRRRDGNFRPAYARYLAISGSNFLSNTWRVNSEADTYHAGLRILYGFGDQIGSNAWTEFWPDVSARIFHKSGK